MNAPRQASQDRQPQDPAPGSATAKDQGTNAEPGSASAPGGATERWPGPFQHLSDEQFSARFLEAGRVHRNSRDVCGGMLPEAQLRQTFRRHGCATLEEFAGKSAGLRKEYVRKVLALFRKISDKPHLSRLLQTGQVGWSKICAVASVATVETDAMWAGLVCTLSKADLEAHVRAYRQQHQGGTTKGAARSGTQEPGSRPTSGAAARAAGGAEAGSAHTSAAATARPDVGAAQGTGAPGAAAAAAAAAAATHGTGAAKAGLGGDPRQPTGPGSAPDSPEHGTGEKPAASSPASAPDPDPDNEEPLPPNHRVSIVVEVLAAEELKRLAEDMRRRDKRPYTDSEVLLLAVRAFRGGEPGRRRYREVIYRAPDGQRVIMTRWGLVRMPDEWLSGAEPAAPPVDLEKERQACERMADAASSVGGERSVPGDGVSTKAPGDTKAPPTPASTPAGAPTEGATGAHRGRRPHRHIPQAILDHVFHRSSGFCEFPQCRRPATILHHVRRFALDPRHGPDDLVHLCRRHEHLAHAGLIANELDPPAVWQVRLERKVETKDEAARARIDAEVRARRARRA